MFCSNCGKKLDDGTNFCTNCGTKINPQANSPSSPTQWHGRDYKNQKIGANLWRNEVSVGGHIYFCEKEMNFKSHSFNTMQCDITILYSEIQDISFINYYMNLIPNGLQITTKDGSVYRFVVWKRQEIKSFIEHQREVVV